MSSFHDLRARLEAFTAARLSADEYEEVKAFDVQVKRHFWRWLALIGAAAAAGTVLLVAIWPTLSWRTAFLFSGVGCMYLLFGFASPWFGYRRWTRRSAMATIATLVAIIVVSGTAAFVAASHAKGHVEPVEVVRVAAVTMLAGLAIASVLVTIARVRLREAIQKSARLEAEAQRERLVRQGAQAELKVLQAQVEPHFLFNTLASVRYLVQGGSADALPMLDHLIQYLRSALPEIRTEASTLGREAQLASSYLAIMRMRVGPRLQVSVDIPQELVHQPFPPLMLMTLVENAVKHGVAPRGAGNIAVAARVCDGVLCVTVADDGPGLGGPIGQGVGLANTRERLRALHGDAGRLELASGSGGGTIATLRVPAS